MKKIILTLILTLGSANLYAGTQCSDGEWVFPPKHDGKVLKAEIRGTCTLDTEGDLEKLKAFYVGKMSDSPEIREVHSVNEKDNFTTEIDSTSFITNENGDLEVRWLTNVELKEGTLLFDKVSTKFIRATGNSKRVRKITEVFKITKTDNGLILEVTTGVNIKVPKMFKKMALKGIKKSFPETINGVAGEVAENL